MIHYLRFQKSKFMRLINKHKENKFHRKLIRDGNRIAYTANITFDSTFEGKNAIGERSTIKWCDVGYGSYIGDDAFFERTKIGRFCSIARGVKVVAGSHPVHTFVSTHPAFFSLMQEDYFGYVHEKKFQELKFADQENRKAVIIGNDVWIGANASIMEGVAIGDGAIIAANALVTKDVRPYELVGGVPAKHMKYRFNEKQIDFLIQFKWWNRSLEWIKEHADEFDDIELFCEKYR